MRRECSPGGMPGLWPALQLVRSAVVAVAPVDPNGVVAHRFHAEHLERRLEHGERIVRLGRAWGGAVGAGAGGAGALVAQVSEAVIAGVAILPIDLDAFRFGNGDVFGIGGWRHFS